MTIVFSSSLLPLLGGMLQVLEPLRLLVTQALALQRLQRSQQCCERCHTLQRATTTSAHKRFGSLDWRESKTEQRPLRCPTGGMARRTPRGRRMGGLGGESRQEASGGKASVGA